VILPGINDGYAGSAPDIGAFELGADLPPWPDGGTGGGGTGGNGEGGGGSGGSGAKSGCGCEVAGEGAEDLAAPLAGLIGLGLLARRRRAWRQSHSR
jgi:MYXO-CTERM domain-containing protein